MGKPSGFGLNRLWTWGDPWSREGAGSQENRRLQARSLLSSGLRGTALARVLGFQKLLTGEILRADQCKALGLSGNPSIKNVRSMLPLQVARV